MGLVSEKECPPAYSPGLGSPVCVTDQMEGWLWPTLHQKVHGIRKQQQKSNMIVL